MLEVIMLENTINCCQSCGIPFNEEHRAKGLIAKETDGSDAIYCTLCYKDGGFTHPDMTAQDMIDLSVQAIAPQFGEGAARKMMEDLIPTLSRWK